MSLVPAESLSLALGDLFWQVWSRPRWKKALLAKELSLKKSQVASPMLEDLVAFPTIPLAMLT